MSVEIKSVTQVFGGQLIRVSHQSKEVQTPMVFAVYLPPGLTKETTDVKVPVLFYLSGLTCTDENVCQKGAPFRKLAAHKIAFVAPDTSPRGANIPGEDDGWDFGTGAGFYVDAQTEAWKKNYRMYSYVTKELFELLQEQFACLDLTRVGIFGHSMGGHGALTIALKNQNIFKSVSAFAPISNPSNCPWGIKAFTGYLGEDKETWKPNDATELLKGGKSSYDNILIDVGTSDSFYKAGQLLPEAFEAVAKDVGQALTVRYQEGYDHSYFFVSTFMEDHIDFHAQRL